MISGIPQTAAVTEAMRAERARCRRAWLRGYWTGISVFVAISHISWWLLSR